MGTFHRDLLSFCTVQCTSQHLVRHGIGKQHQQIRAAKVLQPSAHFRIYLCPTIIRFAKLRVFSYHTFVSADDHNTHDDFLSKIRGIIESPDSQKNLLYKKIINNHYFLQFILDSYLQLYILNDNKDPNKKFTPSFSLDLYKKPNTLEEKEIPLDETEKKDKIKKALNNCEKILLYILTENITNFDYEIIYIITYTKL